jgi:hypothetical protein
VVAVHSIRRIGPMQLTASPNVRCISNSVRMSAAQGSDVSCHKQHFTPQQMAFYSITSLDSKVLGIELAAHTRRSFNSTDREPIVRQPRRRCFIPGFSFRGFDSIPGVILAKH